MQFLSVRHPAPVTLLHFCATPQVFGVAAFPGVLQALMLPGAGGPHVALGWTRLLTAGHGINRRFHNEERPWQQNW